MTSSGPSWTVSVVSVPSDGSGEGSLVGVSAAKPSVLRHMAKQRNTERSAESLRFIWFGPPLWSL